MNPNTLPSECCAVLGSISPDATAPGTVTTAWVPMTGFFSALALVMAGTLGANATVDAKLEQATDAAGTDAKDIDGKAITQLTQAGDDDSDSQALIDLRAEQLDSAGGFTHVRLSLTVGTAASDVGAVLQGFAPRFAPASGSNAATVAEVVQ